MTKTTRAKTTKRVATKTKRAAIDCKKAMTNLCDRFDERSPFESVDVDVERECEDDWSMVYAVAIFTMVPFDEEFFDHERAEERLRGEIVDALGGSSGLTIWIDDGEPSRPLRVGDYALHFRRFTCEAELFEITRSSIEAHENMKARKLARQRAARREAREAEETAAARKRKAASRSSASKRERAATRRSVSRMDPS